ncbi:MAG TPA: hypothetical protein VH108_03850 [Gaiellaceae bacterium]|nr:hypothetical protein [Gaiellaceae bacterium]
MDDLTKKRLEHNEAVFRAVNEVIDDHATSKAARAYVCECSDLTCQETIVLTHDEYRGVREDPSHFVIVPEHERPEVEYVVERHGSHLVVEKPDLQPSRPSSELSSK